MGNNLSQVEDVDNLPLAGLLLKHNPGVDVASDIVNIVENIESVDIDVGTNSLDIVIITIT